jgi:rod shape-determining protein MreC
LPKKRFLQARPFVALGILAAVWMLLPLAVKSLTHVSFYEFQAPANLVASRVRDLQDYWAMRLHSERELIEAGADVARANARYEQTVHQYESLRSEVQRLERLLTMPTRENYRYEFARVVRRDFSGWWQQIIVGKGQNYGIRVDAPVVFTGGVVGKVREVGQYTSVVDLLSSKNVRLAANFEGDNRQVSYRGGLNPSFTAPRGIVEFVPSDIVPTRAKPAILVTSGFGGVFPPGLPIGKVERLTAGPDGQFMIGDVMLDERLGSLSEVAVLVPTQPE